MTDTSIHARIKTETNMRKLIIGSIIVVGLLAPQITQAQGTIYLSNLGSESGSGLAVGSDSWQAEPFKTGTNAGGYVLDSVQLAMVNDFGIPSGFEAMVYGVDPI
jgi:hypothetical protein